MLTGARPCVCSALRKKALAAATSRLGLSEIDRLAFAINGPIQVGPSAVDLDVGLVDAPRSTCLAREPIPSLLKLRHVALNPGAVSSCARPAGRAQPSSPPGLAGSACSEGTSGRTR